MKVRFQADADLNHILIKATLRREPRIDFQTAHAANLAGVEDQEGLAVATQAGRVLVTHDRKTMPKYFAEFIGHTSSSGVIVIPQKLPVELRWRICSSFGQQVKQKNGSTEYKSFHYKALYL